MCVHMGTDFSYEAYIRTQADNEALKQRVAELEEEIEEIIEKTVIEKCQFCSGK